MTALPDVPTLREEGLSGYEVTGWWAAYFPAKTPPAVVATMRQILQKAVRTQPIKDVCNNFGLESMPASGDELARIQQRDSEKWGALVKAANLASH